MYTQSVATEDKGARAKRPVPRAASNTAAPGSTPAASTRDDAYKRARKALSIGHTLTAAAAIAGVSRFTMYEWLNAGDRRADALRQARATGQAELESVVLRDAMKDGKLALDVLGRRSRAWQKKDAMRADVSLRDVTDDEAPEARARRLRSLLAAIETGLPKDGT